MEPKSLLFLPGDNSTKLFFRHDRHYLGQGILKREYHCTIDHLFDWFGISCMTTDNFCFYLQYRLIQTSQTGGQQYSDTSPFSIPCLSQNLQQLPR
jgi:hypothetical protein